MRVLGLDPGIRNTGWCVLECMRPRGHVRLLASGVIVTPKGTLVQKRNALVKGLYAIGDHNVDVTAVETQVRWVGLAVAWAVCCAFAEDTSDLGHVRARQAKEALGVGPKAGKRAVLDAAGSAFIWPSPPSQHEADASAVAFAALVKLGWAASQSGDGLPGDHTR